MGTPFHWLLQPGEMILLFFFKHFESFWIYSRNKEIFQAHPVTNSFGSSQYMRNSVSRGQFGQSD